VSALVAVAFEDRIELLADTAMTAMQPPFLLDAIGSKLAAHTTLSLAMFASGHIQLCAALGIEINRTAGFCETGDDLLDQLPDMLDRMRRRGTPTGQHGTIYMALHGPAGGFQLRSFDTSDVLGREPFKLSSNLEYTMFGPVTEEGFRAHGLNPDMLPLSDGLQSRGLPFMELFRRTPGRLPDEPEGTPGRYFSIGAQLQLCTVTAERATIRTLGYWPDLLGEPIDPTTGYMPAMPSGRAGVNKWPSAVGGPRISLSSR
jgi:hypothetical protein